jgi:nucleoside 2-deoxyribosyltransferase
MTTSSTSWIYLAGPLFTQAEIGFNQRLADRLRTAGYSVYLPQQECSGITDPIELFEICIWGLDGASMVLVILDGADADSGSCFEVGYAFAKGLPIVGLRTDFRGSGEHMGVNLMLTQSCVHLLLTTSTSSPNSHSPRVTYLKIGEDFTPALLEVLSSLPAAYTARTQQ